ncbi:MAG: NAD(P)/FAD-dependent oxidoreductase [Verrucomicrobiota bacterium]
MTDFDVVIVGAGPAGLLCGRMLAEADYRVLILEARSKVEHKLCGAYLCPSGVRLLEEAGLLPAMEQRFHPVHGMILHSPNGQSVTSYFPEPPRKSPSRLHHGLSLDRKAFDTFLAKEYFGAGGHLEMGQRLKNMHLHENGWELETDQHRRIRTRLLIGADGRRSFVAKRLGLSKRSKSKRMAVHAFMPSMQMNPRMGEMHLFDAGDYIGLNPLDQHMVNVSWVCDPATLEGRSAEEALKRRMSESKALLSRFDLSQELELMTTSPLTHRVNRCYGPRSALVGDASGFVDPLTGEGIFVALATARMIASRLVAQPDWVMGDHIVPILQSYHRERKKAFASKKRVSMAFQRIIRSPRVCNAIQRYLAARQQRADSFIGLVGNVYQPLNGLWHMVTAS